MWSGRLVSPDCERGWEEGGNGSRNREPVGLADGAVAEHERSGSSRTNPIPDPVWAPARGISHTPEGEQNPGKALDRTADREHRAADASVTKWELNSFAILWVLNYLPATANGQESKENRQHHQTEAEHKADDGAPPSMGILGVIQIGEQGLDLLEVRDALALEELGALGYLWKMYFRLGGYHFRLPLLAYLAVEKQSDVLVQKLADLAVHDFSPHVLGRIEQGF